MVQIGLIDDFKPILKLDDGHNLPKTTQNNPKIIYNTMIKKTVNKNQQNEKNGAKITLKIQIGQITPKMTRRFKKLSKTWPQ